MNAVETLLKIAGKENTEIDRKIGVGYIMRLCWKYGWMLVRGKAFALAKGKYQTVYSSEPM